MNYKDMLEVVKKQHPDVPYKEQQKMASEMLKKFKSSAESHSSGMPPESGTSSATDVPGVKGKVLPMAQLAAAEKKLRSDVIDINSLITVGREVIPGGSVRKHGLDGVNTMVTFEDNVGNRLPLVGYFRIYI